MPNPILGDGEHKMNCSLVWLWEERTVASLICLLLTQH